MDIPRKIDTRRTIKSDEEVNVGPRNENKTEDQATIRVIVDFGKWIRKTTENKITV